MRDNKGNFIKSKREMIINYKQTFATEQGKAVLKDMMKCAKVNQSCFDQNPYETAYNEGARDFFLRIFRTISTDPDSMDMLQKLGQSED